MRLSTIALYAVLSFIAVFPVCAQDSSVGGKSDWGSENEYWRSHYPTRPYHSKNRNYSVFEPAYRYGLTAYDQYGGKSYEDLEPSQLQKGWEDAREKSNLSWNDAQPAVRDSYKRAFERNHGGVSDQKGGSQP